MRLAFVTPRFQADDPTPPEQLAAELAARAPDGWHISVLTTTVGKSSGTPFREGRIKTGKSRICRFAPGSPANGSKGESDEAVSSPTLLDYLSRRQEEYELILLFGSSSAICRAAARVNPSRTVLLPFALPGTEEDAGAAEIFDLPAAFIFGSGAEEVHVLNRFPLHRRMRETVEGSLMLPRSTDPRGFRRRVRVRGHYLFHAGPLEPGRGIEEAVRYFTAFRDRHPDAKLDLVLRGPAAVRLPSRPDVRVFEPRNEQESVDGLAGALLALVPERLAGFSDHAAEPFSLGVPLLVNASASSLVRDCQASNGGLYYRNYQEFQLILELALRDPSLMQRLGACGREFLNARHDWKAVVARYDRAFRSFARPARPSPSRPSPAAAAPRPARTEKKEARVRRRSRDSEDSPAEAAAQPPSKEAEEKGAGPAAETPEKPPVQTKPPPDKPAQPPRETAADTGAAEASGTPSEPDPEKEASPRTSEPEPAANGLPSFFRGSIRG